MLTLLTAPPARAHPLHTSLATITQSGGENFTVSLRVFSDDFLRHTGASVEIGDGNQPDPRLVSYLMRTLVFIDRNHRGLPLRWCGSKKVGDQLVICLSGKMAGGLRGSTIRYSILSDLFSDEVNLLQIQIDSRKQSLLFTPAETTRVIN